MKMKFLVILATLAFATEHNTESAGKIFEQNAPILVKIEEDEYAKIKKTSKYIGVSRNKYGDNWRASRRSKIKKKMVSNGYYKDEELAAHASDTLARKLMANGEQNHKLNFPCDHTGVWPEQTTSIYIGVCYNRNGDNWRAFRRSKNEKKMVFNGTYKYEETAARASDTLARKLMANAEQNLKLNFPDDDTEVFSVKVTCGKATTSKYIGVCYNKKEDRWRAYRWSKNEMNMFFNGCYRNEKTAAHASDNLARYLMENSEQNLKLNFPGDHTEVSAKTLRQIKRKRSDDSNAYQTEETFEKFE